MKKILPYFLIFSVLLNILLVYFFVFKGNQVAGDQKDARISILISKQNHAFVMTEMRGFLESIRDINEGISEGNRDKIIKAAEKSGGHTIAHAPQGLLKTLPIEFKTLGFDTHRKFDELVKAAKANRSKDEMQQQSNAVLTNCTSCHRSFKFETQP